MSKTDILLLNRSFWPDTEGTGQNLTELCKGLAARYKVRVICGRSYYIGKDGFKLFQLYKREIFAGIEIFRVRHTRFWKANLIGRLLNWLTYTLLTFFLTLAVKTRVIVVCTDPPFLGLVAMCIRFLKGVPYIYNCRDLYPDVAWGLGRLGRHSLLGLLFDYLNKEALHKATFVVPLGESMAKRLINKGISNNNIRVIPNYVDTSKIEPVARDNNHILEKFGLKDKFVAMYSGNLGLSQDFSLILKAAAKFNDDPSFYLVFIGNGVSKEPLKEEARLLGLKNILFLPYQPQEELSFSLSMASLHLVPLKKGLTGTIIPGKVYSIMAAGRPYLALSDRESEPSRLAREDGCGLCAEPEEVNSITDSLKWALQHKQELEEMGRKARCVAETKFDKNIVIKQWFALLSDVC